jgi:hypothetical protein
MLVLKPYEICPYANTCPYNTNSTILNFGCNGADTSRNVEFSCDLINNDRTFIEGKFRSLTDKTGKMKIILG